ncbi:MAG: hypothetical protein U0531_04190 [Dehalococcoidia bacterium]
MTTAVRSVFALLGVGAALLWAVTLTISPRAALELLVLASPLIVTVWLIVMFTGWNRRRARAHAPAAAAPADSATRAAVLARDGGRCAHCGANAAHVAARGPARVGGDPLHRYITLCAACARASVLPHETRGSA